MPSDPRGSKAAHQQKLAKLEEARDLLIQALTSLKKEIAQLRRK